MSRYRRKEEPPAAPESAALSEDPPVEIEPSAEDENPRTRHALLQRRCQELAAEIARLDEQIAELTSRIEAAFTEEVRKSIAPVNEGPASPIGRMRRKLETLEGKREKAIRELEYRRPPLAELDAQLASERWEALIAEAQRQGEEEKAAYAVVGSHYVQMGEAWTQGVVPIVQARVRWRDQACGQMVGDPQETRDRFEAAATLAVQPCPVDLERVFAKIDDASCDRHDYGCTASDLTSPGAVHKSGRVLPLLVPERRDFRLRLDDLPGDIDATRLTYLPNRPADTAPVSGGATSDIGAAIFAGMVAELEAKDG